MNKIPSQIHINEKPVIKMQKKNVNFLKYMCIVLLLMAVMLFLASVNFNNPYGTLNSRMFMPLVLTLITIFFLWQLLSNKLKFKIEILPNKPRIKNPSKQSKGVPVLLVALILAMPFIGMQLYEIFGAMRSNGKILVNYNAFGEGTIEMVLLTAFSIAIGIILALEFVKVVRRK